MQNLILLVTVMAMIFAPSLWAATSLDNVSNSELEDVVNDFSALLTHTSVSGAAPLGDVFGFEIGLVAGMSDTPNVNKISKSVGGSAVESIPHGGVLGVVSFPMGLTAEINILPDIEVDDGDLENVSLAGKWTFSGLLDLPVDAAIKLSHTSSEFSFTQSTPTPGTKVTYESTIQSLMFFASKSFAIVEPYAGFGYVQADGELSATVDIFDDVVGTSASEEISSMQFVGGANLNLLFLKLGFEAAHLFDNMKYSAKVSFYF